MADKERFVKTYSQGGGVFSYKFDVFVDTATGVNYITQYYDHGIGITPLLDKDGKPVITPIENK